MSKTGKLVKKLVPMQENDHKTLEKVSDKTGLRLFKVYESAIHEYAEKARRTILQEETKAINRNDEVAI